MLETGQQRTGAQECNEPMQELRGNRNEIRSTKKSQKREMCHQKFQRPKKPTPKPGTDPRGGQGDERVHGLSNEEKKGKSAPIPSPMTLPPCQILEDMMC